MIRSLYRTQEGSLRTDLPLDQFGPALRDGRGLLWVDFEDTSPEADRPILLDTFGFHPLAVDDALEQSHVPKIDDWSEHVYIVMHAVKFDEREGGRVDTLELDVFLGKNYIVTHHDQSIAAVERVWALCQRDERHVKGGADHLLYRLADEVAASYLPAVEGMDETIDSIEHEVFAKPGLQAAERIFALKRAVLRLRRILGPQREVMNRLARDDYAVIDAKDRVYFRDVYDHLVRMHDITESVRDLVSGALDTYLSVVNNRMNDIVRTLTVITTLFMPLTFVTGFFGMNFFQPTTPFDIWTSLPSLVITFAVMILTPVIMIVIIRRRGWL